MLSCGSLSRFDGTITLIASLTKEKNQGTSHSLNSLATSDLHRVNAANAQRVIKDFTARLEKATANGHKALHVTSVYISPIQSCIA